MEKWLLRILVAGLVGAFVMAAALTPQVRSANPQRGDVLTQVLGGASEMAAESAFQQADLYFHAGVREGDEEHSHKASGRGKTNLPLMSLIRNLQTTAVPIEQRHLENRDEKELLPWFLTTVRLDPRHIEAWCVGGYWYYRVGEYGQAEAFLTDGIRCNPKEYRLRLERGVLFARLGYLKRALRDLRKAKELRPDHGAEMEWHAVDLYLRYVTAKLAGQDVPDLWSEERSGCTRHH